MNKKEFLDSLRGRLEGLPQEDIKRSLEYYSESIDDRIEDGLTEEEAVLALGSMEEIVAQIYAESSQTEEKEEKGRENVQASAQTRPQVSPQASPQTGTQTGTQAGSRASTKPNTNTSSAAKAWLLVLLLFGAPVWLPLLIAVASVLFAAYVVLWAGIIVLYAIDFSFAASAVAGIAGSFAFFPFGNAESGLMFLGVGLVCAGVAILLFFAFNQVAKFVIWVSKSILLGVKSLFVRKGGAK